MSIEQPPSSSTPTLGPLLRGQTALVTGASSGIGQGIAKALGQAGADVAVNYRSSEQGAKETVSAIEAAGQRAIAIQADVSQEDQVEAMVQKTIETFGTLDILISNSGIQVDAPYEEMTLEAWNQVLSVNLTGTFLCTRAAIREFLRRGPRPEVSRALGKIICISSVHEIIPWAGHANYATSKGGLLLLVKTLAQEFANRQIRINGIAPGAIATPINQEAWDDPASLSELLKLIPAGRIGTTEDVANAAVWLASDLADYIHGQSLVIDGGMALYPEFVDNG